MKITLKSWLFAGAALSMSLPAAAQSHPMPPFANQQGPVFVQPGQMMPQNARPMPVMRAPNHHMQPLHVRRHVMPAHRPVRPVVRRPHNGRYGAVMPASTRGQMRSVKKPSGAKALLDKVLNRDSDSRMYANYPDRIRGHRLPQYQMAPRQPHPMDQFLRWQNTEPEYALYPGDQIDIVVASAPELSRTLTIGPDGRVVMPMSEPVMAAGRTMGQVEAAISANLAKQLVDPKVVITPRAYGPQQVFIGGEVGAQGTYTLPGPIGTMEAILMAGGFSTSAGTREVVVLRRTANGAFMARTIDYRDGLRNPVSLADNIQLRRGDIIFVPRSDISEIGLFMQQYVRDALPVQLGLSYNLGETSAN